MICNETKMVCFYWCSNLLIFKSGKCFDVLENTIVDIIFVLRTQITIGYYSA